MAEPFDPTPASFANGLVAEMLGITPEAAERRFRDFDPDQTQTPTCLANADTVQSALEEPMTGLRADEVGGRTVLTAVRDGQIGPSWVGAEVEFVDGEDE